MRHNGHLLQTNKGVADIGSPATLGSSSTRDDTWYTKTTGVSRAVESGMITYLDSETRYRNIYADCIFLGRKDSGVYSINDFFTNLPKENEVLTAGQTSDYMLNSSKGLFPGWVGNHFSESSIYNLWTSAAGTTKPNQSTWNNSSLYDKMRLVLDDLIGSGPGLFNIKANNIDSDTITGEGSFDATSTGDFNAGQDESDGKFILSVIAGDGSSGNRKEIWINRQINGTSSLWYPSGIAGTYYSGETYDNRYDSGDYSFVDVGRYYLRNSIEKGNNIHATGSSYLSANGRGAMFKLADRYVTIPYPSSSDAETVTNFPPFGIEITMPNNQDFKIKPSGTGAFGIFDLGGNGDFVKTTVNGLSVGKTNSCLLRNQSITPTYAAEYHFLTSEAGENMYGGNPGANTYVPFLNFRYGVDAEKNVSIGMKGSAYGSNFYVRQRTSTSDKRCYLPEMTTDSVFIISGASIAGSDTQSINTSLSCAQMISCDRIKAGPSAPEMKVKKISNTTTAEDEATKTIAHGIDSIDKILSVSIMLEYSTANLYHLPGEYYNATVGATNITLTKESLTSIGGRKYKILITYEP